jgi:hypothetical protein
MAIKQTACILAAAFFFYLFPFLALWKGIPNMTLASICLIYKISVHITPETQEKESVLHLLP